MTAPRSLTDLECELIDALGQAEALADLLQSAHLSEAPPANAKTTIKAAECIQLAVQRAEAAVAELLDLVCRERRA